MASIAAFDVWQRGNGTKVGTVLQVVNSNLTSDFITTSTSFVSTGLTASITPSSTTSKVFAFVTGGYVMGSTSGAQCVLTIYRNSTNLVGVNGLSISYNSAGALQTPVSLGIIDSPATTSATSYTVYIYSANGGQSVSLKGATSNVSLILMEIQA